MSSIDLLKKIDEYDKDRCYQYQRRIDTFSEDLKRFGWTKEYVDTIKLDDFEFTTLNDESGKEMATEFIKRYEWLGTVGHYPTHWFGAFYHGHLGGVIIMSMPNAFSKLMGEETKTIERLIARGASASWTPKNLGSKFLMWCLKWMAKNTQYRLFTCYSDTDAKERGKIYQALNFYYLGQCGGTTVRCVNPYDPTKIVTDRAFRARSFYKRYAKELGIVWQHNWVKNSCVDWSVVPEEVHKALNEMSKKKFEEAKKIEFPKKHKYAFIIGKNNSETKFLRKKFLEENKIYPYPEDPFETIPADEKEFENGKIKDKIQTEFDFFNDGE